MLHNAMKPSPRTLKQSCFVQSGRRGADGKRQPLEFSLVGEKRGKKS